MLGPRFEHETSLAVAKNAEHPETGVHIAFTGA